MLKIKHLLMFCVTTLLTLSLVSCLDDNNEVTYPPVKLEDIPGSYTGKVKIVYNNLSKEELINSTVTKDSMTIVKFPMREIISSFEEDEVKVNEILNSINPLQYAFAYKAEVRQEYGGAELFLDPKPLNLEVMTAAGKKTLQIKFSAKENGFYGTVEKAMAIRLNVDEIIVDGLVIESFKGISYTMPFLVKTAK